MLCKGAKRDGSPCTLPARGSSTYCWAHDPANAERRREAASRGGKARHGGELSSVKSDLRQLARDVLDGRVTPGKASVTSQVLGVYLRACEQQRREVETEQLAAELQELRELVDNRSGQGAAWG